MFTRNIWFKFFSDLNSFVILLRFWKESAYLWENIFFEFGHFERMVVRVGIFARGKSSYFTRERERARNENDRPRGRWNALKLVPAMLREVLLATGPRGNNWSVIMSRGLDGWLIFNGRMIFSRISLSLCRGTIPRTLEKVSRSGRLFVRVCGFWPHVGIVRYLDACRPEASSARLYDPGSFENFDNGPALKAV